MAIKNSRSRKAARSRKMETQELISNNHRVVNETIPPMNSQPQQASMPLDSIKERREKMIQGLNSVKAERDAIEQRLKDLETSVSRTEGAVIALNNLIAELDPEEAQRMGMGG